MYNERIENLISAALADGTLTEKEKQILFKNAEAQGIDLDEFEMILDARLVELKKNEVRQSQKHQIELEKAKAAAQAQPAAPTSNKMGDIKKCPACGAIISGYQAKCLHCGYEFSNIEANSSSMQLLEMLRTVDRENKGIQPMELVEKHKTVISNFPVPITKADLFEFISSLEPKASDYSFMGDLSAAYLAKYEECLNKAKTFFPNDPMFTPFIQGLAFVRKRRMKKMLKPLYFLIGLFLFSIMTAIIIEAFN